MRDQTCFIPKLSAALPLPPSFPFGQNCSQRPELSCVCPIKAAIKFDSKYLFTSHWLKVCLRVLTFHLQFSP